MPEYGAPPQVKPKRLGDYLEVMSKAVFQSGMSWQVVNKKWDGIRDAFRDFDAEAVARLGEREIDALTQDTRVIRNRRKIEAIIENANKMLALEAEHGGFRKYLRSHGGFEATVADLRKQFKFVGESGCYIFLYIVGEEVPPHEEWEASRKK
ncbi:MAG: DNA-3-methyladenine glycosylase I [Chloroflexi bacterium]|nr:DNA-3-methyladenine glycosylase I [Chloroflexota bacterium]